MYCCESSGDIQIGVVLFVQQPALPHSAVVRLSHDLIELYKSFVYLGPVYKVTVKCNVNKAHWMNTKDIEVYLNDKQQ